MKRSISSLLSNIVWKIAVTLALLLWISCIPKAEQDLYVIDPAQLLTPADNIFISLHKDSTASIQFSWNNPVRPDFISARITIGPYSFDASDASEFILNVNDTTFTSSAAVEWYVEVNNALYNNQGSKRHFFFEVFQTITTVTSSTTMTSVTTRTTTTNTGTTVTTSTLTSTSSTSTSSTSTLTSTSTTLIPAIVTYDFNGAVGISPNPPGDNNCLASNLSSHTAIEFPSSWILPGWIDFDNNWLGSENVNQYIQFTVNTLGKKVERLVFKSFHNDLNPMSIAVYADVNASGWVKITGSDRSQVPSGQYIQTIDLSGQGLDNQSSIVIRIIGWNNVYSTTQWVFDWIKLTTQFTGATTTTTISNFLSLIGGSNYDGPSAYRPSAIAIDDGYLILGDTTSMDGDFGESTMTDNNIVLVKLNRDGQFDPTFHGNGIRVIQGSGDDRGSAIVRSSNDTGFVLAVRTSSTDGDFSGRTNYGGGDIAFIKIKADGNIDLSWGINGMRIFGGTQGDVPYEMVTATDGGYAIAAWSYSTDGHATGNHGNYDTLICKVRIDGSVDTTFGGGDGVVVIGGTGYDLPYGLLQLSNGNFFIIISVSAYDGDIEPAVGVSGYSMSIVSLTQTGAFNTAFDSNGVKTFGSGGSDNPYGIFSDGVDIYGYGFAGTQTGTWAGLAGIANDAVIFKVSQTGAAVTSFGSSNGALASSGNANDAVYDMKSTWDGQLIALLTSGSTNGIFGGTHGGNDIFLLKLSSTGGLDAGFGTSGVLTFGGSNNDSANLVMVTADRKFIVAASSDSADGDLTGYLGHGSADLLVFSVDEFGNF